MIRRSNGLIELWPTHWSSQPYSKFDRKNLTTWVSSKYYAPVLPVIGPSSVRRLQTCGCLLWEHVLTGDRHGILQDLSESPIGNPITNTSQRQMHFLRLWAHSVRERNQMLSTGGFSGTEGLFGSRTGCRRGPLSPRSLDAPRIIALRSSTSRRRCMFHNGTSRGRFPDEKIFEFRPFEHFSEIEQELANSRFAFFTANQIELFATRTLRHFLSTLIR